METWTTDGLVRIFCLREHGFQKSIKKISDDSSIEDKNKNVQK